MFYCIIFSVIVMEFRNIRNLREDNDYTQSFVAEKLGITQRAYSYYENGGRTLTPELLIKIADFYNVSIDYLLGQTNNKNRNI